MNETAGLNENHVRHVLATFRYLDGLLARAEHVMVSAGSPSPFQEYADDTTPLQRQVTRDYIASLRETMSRHLEELGIPRPAPVGGALWAAQTAVNFAGIALAEMESKRLRGYGRVSAEVGERIDSLVAELRVAIDKLCGYLAQGAGGDLQARLRRLEQTSNEAGLLRELERIVTAHGLVEFRNAVAMLLDRMENRTLEIGVFGRVNSGKSSLLNHLLGGNPLPVGVTPVTAVPTRVSFGPHPQIVLEFASGRTEVVGLSALAGFATEQQNAGNAKHVASIRVQWPAALLREGITFVDTPGLGSLATHGAEETVAYLPRCDLGIVLVDAASALAKDDLKIIQALYQAGATVMVLVSKADLLASVDRERALEYAQQQIRSEANLEPPVHLVGVVGAETKLCDEWFESELRPKLEARRELMATSLKRKVGGLRAALLETLRRKADAGAAGRPGPETARMREVESEFRKMSGTLESARREAEEGARNLSRLDDRIIAAAADSLAANWLDEDPRSVNPAEIVSATVTRSIAGESRNVKRCVEDVRARLAEILQAAAHILPASGSAFAELPRLAGLPLPDPSAVAAATTLPRPVILAIFGRGVLRSRIRAKLREQIDSALHDLLEDYRRRLSGWARESFGELDAVLSAGAGIYRPQLAGSHSPATCEAAPDQTGLREDIRVLERWGQPDKALEAQPA